MQTLNLPTDDPIGNFKASLKNPVSLADELVNEHRLEIQQYETISLLPIDYNGIIADIAKSPHFRFTAPKLRYIAWLKLIVRSILDTMKTHLSKNPQPSTLAWANKPY